MSTPPISTQPAEAESKLTPLLSPQRLEAVSKSTPPTASPPVGAESNPYSTTSVAGNGLSSPPTLPSPESKQTPPAASSPPLPPSLSPLEHNVEGSADKVHISNVAEKVQSYDLIAAQELAEARLLKLKETQAEASAAKAVRGR